MNEHKPHEVQHEELQSFAPGAEKHHASVDRNVTTLPKKYFSVVVEARSIHKWQINKSQIMQIAYWTTLEEACQEGLTWVKVFSLVLIRPLLEYGLVQSHYKAVIKMERVRFRATRMLRANSAWPVRWSWGKYACLVWWRGNQVAI